MNHKNRLSFIAVVFSIVIGLLIGCGGGWLLTKRIPKPSEASASESTEPEETPTPAPEVYDASLFMTGDTVMHRPLVYEARQADGSYDFSHLLGRVIPYAQKYDLRYYNQETILGGDERAIQGYPTFNTPQAFGDYMVSNGFNLVSNATNHSLDQGVDGALNSINYWKQQEAEGVHTAGMYASAEEQAAVPVYEVNGITYSFFSWTYGMNGFQNPDDMPYLVNCFDGREDEMCNQIRAAKEKADVVIVAVHWGTEYQFSPDETQTALAQRLADAGADIIIGNHPHAIQPIQWLNDHKTICFYALGNLCAAQYFPSTIEMMAALNIHKTVDQGRTTIEIQNVKADLMYQYYKGEWYGFEVIPFADMTDDTYLDNHQAVYDEYKSIITELEPTIQIGGM